ncbi:Hypothetical protein R9X50_00637900 [Acrodontium crateriforme]|uniref:Cytochrome b5 heme-binding domain-containing protein n=1 Tax=Acrodontium crateriforme TaxID=150365 RepID=A0AAQ3M875_9PEZI|nr:Hypothetical protein R9X50_00637900 [Acrodontium crateriforme]
MYGVQVALRMTPAEHRRVVDLHMQIQQLYPLSMNPSTPTNKRSDHDNATSTRMKTPFFQKQYKTPQLNLPPPNKKMSPSDEVLRRRTRETDVQSKSEPTLTRKQKQKPDENENEDEDRDDSKFGATDVLRVLLGLILLNCLLSYFITNDNVTWNYKPWFLRPKPVLQWLRGPVLLTDIELQAYDGSDPSKPLYIALNGTIYDVTAGARVYGPGGPYHMFAGKDAARAFITGCFAEDAVPDLRGVEWTYMPAHIRTMEEEKAEKIVLSTQETMERFRALKEARGRVKETLESWAKMFRGDGGKDYFEAGRVVREDGWLQKLPRRGLCEVANNQRPQRGETANDPGAGHRS